MGAANLTTGRTKLGRSMKKLLAQWDQTKETWHDSVREKFGEEYVEPLPPKVQSAMQGIERLTQILMQAEKECS